MAVIELRICQRCNQEFQPTARGQKFCGKQKVRGTCSWHRGQELTKKWIADNPGRMKEHREAWWQKLINDPERYQKYLARVTRTNLKHHNITPEQYEAKLVAQTGVCAICARPHGRALAGRSKQLAVDHDHDTNQLRDLLCDDCNLGLGLFRDDPQRLMNAAIYVLYHKDRGGHPIPTMDETQHLLIQRMGR